jgi:Skp family chaperone for outer membrane proteins
MKRYLIVLFTALASLSAAAQAKGVKIAYIDMEYILSKAPDFAEAKNQLEQRAAKWKQEMDVKRNEINKLKESLQAEKALLTKELIDEREEEIASFEKDLSDYQEKKFGPKGELITQKTVLVKPIQDQVFSIVQDLAEARKYDFVFDKSSDLTMIFSAKKHNISDLIVKRMARGAKQEKLTSKQAKKLDEEEKLEEEKNDPDYIDKQKALDDKKAARQKLIDDRKAAAEARKQAALDKRDQTLRDRQAAKDAKKNGTTPPATTKPAEGSGSDVNGTDDDPAPNTNKQAAPAGDDKATDEGTTDAADKAAAAKAAKEAAAEDAKKLRQEKLDERNKAIEQRKKEAQEKRDAAKKAREDKQNGTATPATTDPTGGDDDPPATGGN